MKLTPTSLAWISLAGALCTWTGVILFALSIQSMVQNLADTQGTTQAQNDQQITALKTHVLAQEIAPARTALENMLQSDPLSLAALIVNAGKDANVALQVSSASPENPSPSAPAHAPSASSLQISAIDFTAEADGGFSALARAAAFLETLPVPSAIQELDFGRAPAGTGTNAGAWHMDVHLRMLTSSQLSS